MSGKAKGAWVWKCGGARRDKASTPGVLIGSSDGAGSSDVEQTRSPVPGFTQWERDG